MRFAEQLGKYVEQVRGRGSAKGIMSAPRPQVRGGRVRAEHRSPPW